MFNHGSDITSPSLSQLREMSLEFNFDLNDDELQLQQVQLTKLAKSYSLLESLPENAMAEEVNATRSLGYMPSPDQNTHNAWYWKCNIKGSNQGILKDKTIAIKDNIAVRGVPMMNGSRLIEGYTPEFDATVVTRVLGEGATIVGKTTCEGLCTSAASYITKRGPVRHPIYPSYQCGGSSSGSAVAVTLGEADMAIGGDQGGSVRIPASMCGLVGMKPTFGLVPYTGAYGTEVGLDHLGPITKTVEDCALLLEAIAYYDDGRDPRQTLNMPEIKYSTEITEKVRPFKVACLTEAFNDTTDQRIVDCVLNALNVCSKNKVFSHMSDVTIPMHKNASRMLAPIQAEGYTDTLLNRYGGGPNFNGVNPSSMSDQLFKGIKCYPQDLTSKAKMYAMWAQYIRSRYGDHFYAKSRSFVHNLTKAYDDVLKEYDVIVLPTLPLLPSKIPDDGSTLEDALVPIFTTGALCVPFNATGHPALSLNVGHVNVEDNVSMPVGMSVVGKKFDDVTVLRAAKMIETALKKSN